jgi:hypothetical protein
MKHQILIFSSLICLSASLSTQAQSLITNPGFETYSSCPSGIAQLNRAVPHQILVSHGGSADYLNTCATAATVRVPNNAFGTQPAHGGNAYIGFALYYMGTADFREYVCSPLSSPTTIGTTYTIGFWASLGDTSQYSTDDLQFYFAGACPTGTGGWGPLTSLIPQASLATGTYINSKTTWTYFSTTVLATSAWSTVTMGNFLNDASTSTVYVSPGLYSTAYIYMDDYNVTPLVILDAELQGPVVEEREGIEILWSTSREENTSYWEVERSTGDALHFTAIGRLDAAHVSTDTRTYRWVDPNPAQNVIHFYRIALVSENGETTYSQTVTILPESGEDWFQFDGPNPVREGNTLSCSLTRSGDAEITSEIMDLSGGILKTLTQEPSPNGNTFSISTEGLSAGTYLLRVSCGSHRVVKRILILPGG